MPNLTHVSSQNPNRRPGEEEEAQDGRGEGEGGGGRLSRRTPPNGPGATCVAAQWPGRTRRACQGPCVYAVLIAWKYRSGGWPGTRTPVRRVRSVRRSPSARPPPLLPHVCAASVLPRRVRMSVYCVLGERARRFTPLPLDFSFLLLTLRTCTKGMTLQEGEARSRYQRVRYPGPLHLATALGGSGVALASTTGPTERGQPPWVASHHATRGRRQAARRAP